MNKKKTFAATRKLPGIQRETLRSLSETELAAAAGASATMSCCGNCTNSGFLSCIVVC
jgi:hypothetical protein